MRRISLTLFALLIVGLPRVAFPQGSSSKTDQADQNIQAINNPTMRGLDVLGIAGGIGLIWWGLHIPRTPELAAKEQKVLELTASLGRESPKLIELRGELAKIQAIETLDEARPEFTNIDLVFEHLKEFADKYGKDGAKRKFSKEGLEQLRQAREILYGDSMIDRRGLKSAKEKNQEINEVRGEIAEAEKGMRAETERIRYELDIADHDFKRSKARLFRETAKARYVKIVGGAIILGGGGVDLFFAIKDSISTARLATPHEIGQIAGVILADLKREESGQGVLEEDDE